MEGSIIFYTYGSTLELNGQQFEAGRLTEDLLNLSPDDYHPLHERMVRIRTLMDIYEYVRKSELWWKLNDEMEQLCQELRRYTVFRLLPDDCYDAFFSVIPSAVITRLSWGRYFSAMVRIRESRSALHNSRLSMWERMMRSFSACSTHISPSAAAWIFSTGVLTRLLRNGAT